MKSQAAHKMPSNFVTEDEVNRYFKFVCE